MTELICITCPKGCHLQVDDKYHVTGNACPRGEIYGRNELQHPVRVLTSTVRLEGAPVPRLPVKTAAPIPKGKLFDAMRALDHITMQCPVHCGDIVLNDICGTGIAVVATKTYDASVNHFRL